jgi:hypothetical protein
MCSANTRYHSPLTNFRQNSAQVNPEWLREEIEIVSLV